MLVAQASNAGAPVFPGLPGEWNSACPARVCLPSHDILKQVSVGEHLVVNVYVHITYKHVPPTQT